jgi:hypothetical protein
MWLYDPSVSFCIAAYFSASQAVSQPGSQPGSQPASSRASQRISQLGVLLFSHLSHAKQCTKRKPEMHRLGMQKQNEHDVNLCQRRMDLRQVKEYTNAASELRSQSSGDQVVCTSASDLAVGADGRQ